MVNSMKLTSSAILAIFAFSISTVIACDMPEGFHEFETFGENNIYLSHYPMFGSIHSYQIVLKADFMQGSTNVNSQFLSFRKNNPNISFSTSPIRSDGSEQYAVLPDYAVVGATFVAHVHYAAGKKQTDTDLFKNVTVVVKEVLINRLMNQPAVGAATTPLNYIYFGDQQEAYLLHQMQWDPDFDQIVQIKPLTFGKNPACTNTLTLSNRKNNESGRLMANETVNAVNTCSESFTIDSQKEIREEKMSIQH